MSAVRPKVSSVYVHAPFCVRRCVYCDFAVTVSSSGAVDDWAEAVAAELELTEREGFLSLAPQLETLYVGGGTPSLLGPTAMRRLSEVFGADRLSGSGLEWTAEANPESVTADLAEAWRAAGVNRVSIGVQSFHAPTLRWMGRLHGPHGAGEAVRVARGAGFDNVSVDLIFGLPAHLGRSWIEDLERALALDVPHVSLYGLSVEAETPLGRAVAAGKEALPEEERYRDEFLEASDRLRSAGYVHYEVSSFARPGYESRHNRAYWDGRPYLGLGNGAHSYAHPVRRWNVRDWARYRALVLAGTLPEEAREELDAEAEALERIWLGLRTAEGLPRARLAPEARVLVERWEGAGLAARDGDRLRLTPLGWLELDGLAVEMDRLRPSRSPRRVPPARVDP
ncbi:MAG TPA: radical SAM family heme chaperone HemW [Longimicrobiales bacterium]|nr:radical SAM family heme chaperone HemW [Longimicrobiales bacterium]